MGSGAGFVLLAFPVLLASFEREREGGGEGGLVNQTRESSGSRAYLRCGFNLFTHSFRQTKNKVTWRTRSIIRKGKK